MNNHLFIAPIAQHDMPEDTFLLVRPRSHQNFKIRNVDGLYCLGQQQPFRIIPDPSSQKWKQYENERTKVYIYRNFPIQTNITLENFKNEMKDFPPQVVENVFKAITEKPDRSGLITHTQ
eukprot:UN30219